MIAYDILLSLSSGKLERSLPESFVFVITTMGNVQSMKPVHICLGFIFCSFSALALF